MHSDIRILLVNAINPAVEVEARYPNLGLGYLAASVQKHLPHEKITFSIIDHNIRETLKNFRPHLVGISSVSQNYNIALQYADVFAQQNIPVIFGGIHITALPQTLPKTAVAGCLGEAELTFVDLVKLFLDEALIPERLQKLPGIIFWEGDTLVKTEPRPLIANLDSIPFPARNLLTIRPHTYMFTSRGCPYRCTFCASTRFWDKLRFFSAEYVADEIELLIRDYHVAMISFFDDLFVANRKRLEAIIRLLEKKNFLGNVQFTCSCRANIVDKELAAMLSRMGVVSVGIGLESGDEEILQYLKGKSIHIEDNHKAINLLKDAGIAVNGSFVIGSPQETEPQIMTTYHFIKNSRLDLFDIYLLTPYPGTPVWEYAEKRNLVSKDMADWSILDVNAYRSPDKAIVLSESLSRKEIIKLYKRFRTLRFRRNLMKVFHHPMRRDLLRMAWNLGKEYFHNFHT